MSLFQNTVIKKQIIANADKISKAYKLYAGYPIYKFKKL